MLVAKNDGCSAIEGQREVHHLMDAGPMYPKKGRALECRPNLEYLPDEMVDCGGPEHRYLRELELKNGRSVDWSIELSNVQAVELRPNRPKERNSPNRSKRRSVNVADPYTCRYVLEEWDRGGTLECSSPGLPVCA